MPPLYGVVFHDPMRQPTKKPLHDLWRLTASYPGRQSRPHLFHVVRKVCTKSGHVSTIPSVVKNNSHHGISTIKSDYPLFLITALRSALSQKYSWSDSISMKSIKDDVFRLPVDNDGNLDWTYMDEYMSTVLKEVEATLENLSSVAFYTRNSLR